MSYNISRWNTKEIAGLRLPVAAVHNFPGAKVYLERDGTVKVYADTEGFKIAGRVEGGDIAVDAISMWGIASGWHWDKFKALLGTGAGRLVATQLWEDGDSMSRLTVQDGDVREEAVEL